MFQFNFCAEPISLVKVFEQHVGKNDKPAVGEIENISDLQRNLGIHPAHSFALVRPSLSDSLNQTTVFLRFCARSTTPPRVPFAAG